MTLAIIDDPSPNFGGRKEGKNPQYIVLHYTGTPSLEISLHNLKGGKRGHDVSAHYLIGEEGRVIRLVDEEKRAWHAGKSYWRGETDMNSVSIGIEIQNPGHEHGYRPFPNAQIKAVIALCKDIMARRGIPPQNILAHSDIAPERKEDPGELFPWEALAKEGIGLWPGADGIEIEEDIRQLLTKAGYDPTANLEKTIIAFQRRYEQELFRRGGGKPGVASSKTKALLYALVEKQV